MYSVKDAETQLGSSLLHRYPHPPKYQIGARTWAREIHIAPAYAKVLPRFREETQISGIPGGCQCDITLRRVSRGTMGLFPATRRSVKACLRPPTVSPASTRLPLHLVRVSLRPSITSFHRTFTLSSRLFQQPIRPTDHDRQTDQRIRPTVGEKLQAVGAEKIWTIPNVLTFSRILSCPALGYAILHHNFYVATGLLLYAGLTDLVRTAISVTLHQKLLILSISHRVQVDGYLARRYNMGSVLGSILDPAADKVLMTTLVVTLTVGGLVPRMCARI